MSQIKTRENVYAGQSIFLNKRVQMIIDQIPSLPQHICSTMLSPQARADVHLH